MKEFENYFSAEAIISYLCTLRANVAKSRNERHLIHLLTGSEEYNYHVDNLRVNSASKRELINEYDKYEKQFLSDLGKLFPSRKQWSVLGEKSRVNKITGQLLSSTDRNYYSLIKTIKSFRRKSPNAPWLQALDNFILDIQNSVSSFTYSIPSPTVYPKLKNKKSRNGINSCRPISLFSLKDRVILSITNKYLTIIFDKYFQDCSYAFRSKKTPDNSSVVTYHDCIRKILDYQNNYQNETLWVVECDIEKFYDTVNHNQIRKFYEYLTGKVRDEFPSLDLTKPTHIFNEYLNCYCFNKNVPLNTNLEYWKSYRIPNGEFEWVGNRFKELGYYSDIETERIGIPQGGALSGLITNIVLDIADKRVLETDVFYVRYCDDMIILHPEKDVCLKAKDSYVSALQDLKLVPHKFSSNLISKRKGERKNLPKTTIEHFWKGKSKDCYKWASISEGGFPWIGFVGYELHYKGYSRIRKRSLKKEMMKQKNVVDEIRKAISEHRRKSLGSVSESAIHRLVGMSVGRITLRNYNSASTDMCWKNGFRELTMNKYSIQQIKQLDRNRNKLYYDLKKELEKMEENESGKNIKSKSRQVIHFNKPFSYYYQVLERKLNEK